MTRRLTLPTLIVLCYGLLALLRMNTLTLHPTEYVPLGYPTDYHHFHWDYWWIRHALSEGLPLYRTTYLLFPLGEVNLGMHTLTPFWFPVWAVFEPLFGTIAAMDIILWLGFVLAGGWMYVLLKDYTSSRNIAFIGGMFFMLLPALFRAAEHNHPNLMGMFFLPLTLWLWRRVVASKKWSWAAALGLALWLMWMTGATWMLLVPAVLGPYGLLTLFQAPSWQARRQLVILGSSVLIIFAALGYGIAPYRQAASFDRSMVSPASKDTAEFWSMDFNAYVLMSGDFRRGHSLGHALMLLVVVSVFLPNHANRERWFWLALAGAMMVLSLGPDGALFDHYIPLPYGILHETLDGLFRAPERFVKSFTACILIFLALSWQPYVAKLSPKRGFFIFSIAILVIAGDLRLHHPLAAGPPLPAPTYAFHQLMGEEPYDYVVMDVPVSMSSGWLDVGNNQYTEFYTVAHGKRIVNGLVSRLPDYTHYYYWNEAVLGWLAGTQGFTDETRTKFEQYAYAWPIGYVVAYQNAMGKTASTQDTLGILNGLDFLCPITVERDAVLYRAAGHPEFDACPPRYPSQVEGSTWEINFGLQGDEIFIGQGWYWQEDIGGPLARWSGAGKAAGVFLDLPTGADYTLTLQAVAFYEPREVQVLVNGEGIGTLHVLSDDFEVYTLTIPAEAINEDEHIMLQFVYDDAVSAVSIGASPDERELAIAVNWLRFESLE